ncbi:anti-sigma factor [Actinoplanes sp. NPDC023714]|uniref:anti-sigma factor n=1 Tax=Actinoplanes sp. NPDC023714 TaxID=3154322 RepID=UPI0033FE60AD
MIAIALAEDSPEGTETGHLAECAACHDEVEALRHVAGLGAEAGDLRDLPPPPEHLWQSIEAGIREDAVTTGLERKTGRERKTDLERKREHREKRRSRPRWLVPALAAAAAAIAAVAGTITVERLTERQPAAEVTARATLEPLATVPPSAGGDVRVLADQQVLIDVRNLPLTSGFHEVWLLDPDDPAKMVALGSLAADGTEAALPLPAGTDLNRFRLVDVSDEPHDGDATHSGRSLLRGTLEN